MSNTTEKFTISFEFSEVFEKNEIWPDGDAPKNPNIKDVLEKIKKEGSFSQFINNWNLNAAIDVSIGAEKDILYTLASEI